MAGLWAGFWSDSVIDCQIEGAHMSTSLSELEAHRDRLKRQLSDLGDLRPGSLVERYRKCGKPNCHCAQPDEPGHGPSWSLTHNVKGKTTTKIISESVCAADARAHRGISASAPSHKRPGGSE